MSRPQHMAALERANKARLTRARTRRRVRAKELHVIAAMDEPYSEGMTLSDLLLAVPGVGITRMKRILRECGIPEGKTIGALTERQRGVFEGVVSSTYLTGTTYER